MGDNRWRDEHAWPLARARYTPFYLHSAGAANTLDGDERLSVEPPADEPVDTYVYDPRNPVPTRGGGLCCSPAALAAGAFDQRAIESRPDVLVHTSAPLQSDLEVTGPIRIHLWAATSAPTTDFTAKLVDVGTCGYARNVTDGIVRLPAGSGDPGAAREVAFDLPPTSNVFKAGHRIRVEVSSSNFPRFDRNLNTGQSGLTSAETRVAMQTILHDAAHPSRIVLPVIPR
jgi:putative CocE/NonD family hydrolase